MEVPRTVVVTSEPYYWCLKPFSYLFNTFFGKDFNVTILGYRPIEFSLPDNFFFYSINKRPYPQTEWSNGLAEFLDKIEDEVILLMLDDYFLTRSVDVYGIAILREFMRGRDDILKIDVTADRLHAHGDARNARDYCAVEYLDIIQTANDVQYQMSLQAALWNRRRLLSMLRPNMTPWEVELYLIPTDDMLVLGTRQVPMKYANVVYKGSVDNNQVNLIPEAHRQKIASMIPYHFSVPLERP